MKVPRHDGSRYKILVENPDEQAVMARIKELALTSVTPCLTSRRA